MWMMMIMMMMDDGACSLVVFSLSVVVCVNSDHEHAYTSISILDPSLFWKLNYQLCWVHLRIFERWAVTECEVQVIKHTESTVLYSLSSCFNAYKAVCNISIDETVDDSKDLQCWAVSSVGMRAFTPVHDNNGANVYEIKRRCKRIWRE